MITIGNIKKYTFNIEKKENYFLDVIAKDQRKLKFRFESPNSYFRMNDAMSRVVEISKQKDMFAFDYAMKMREINPRDNLMTNEDTVTQIVMKEFDRMGVNSEEGRQLFKPITMDNLARIKFRIDLPSQVYIPTGLGPDDHLKCATARTHGRFPTLAYYNNQLGFSIWRSSAQNSDTKSRRKPDDEAFLASLNKNADPNQNLYIFNHSDENASMNSVENVINYKKTKTVIYKMSDPRQVGISFDLMWEACQNYKDHRTKFMSKIEKSKWFELVNKVIEKSQLVA